jgi:hypothetical protein
MKPASPPAWLLSLVRKSIPAKPSRSTAYPLKSKRAMAYAKAALDHEQQRLASAPLHQRNNTLNRCAFRLGQLVAGGYLVESDVAARLKRTAAEMVSNLPKSTQLSRAVSGLARGLLEGF